MNDMCLSRRSRAVFILDYLKKNSDEQHPVDAAELVRAMEALGFNSERKAIYEDIKALQDMGYDIIHTYDFGNGYFIGTREFEIPEIYLLIDAVQSASFISPSKTRGLVSKLQGMVSRHEADSMLGRVCIENRGKCSNEAVYRVINDLNEAIFRTRQVEIGYTRHILSGGGLDSETKEMTVNPYALMWDSDHYYLIGNNAKYDNLTHLRIDRISSVKILKTEARHFGEVSEYAQRFDTADYARKTFNMFGGELQRIDLECDVSLLDQMLDKFGTEIMIRHESDAPSFRFSTDAIVSDGLVGWLMQFGGRVKVLSPKTLKSNVAARIDELKKAYE